MPTNQQRREAERRRLQRQLEERRAREAARKRFTLIGSVIGTLVVIGAVIGIVLATTGGSGKSSNAAGHDTITGGASSPTPAPTTSTPAAAVPQPTKPCAGVPKGTTASFEGVTVSGTTDLKHAPTIKSSSKATPATLACEDLVVGKGKAATGTSTVSVQYTGLLYRDGTKFDSSWDRGQAASFSIAPGKVIPGFSQGIGGAGKVAPMHVGGRRIMILPASVAYGASPPAGSNIPPNAPLVFIVDLKSVSA